MTKDFIIYYFIIICEKMSIKLSHYFKLLGICQRHWVSAQKKQKLQKLLPDNHIYGAKGARTPDLYAASVALSQL
ncbi:hypothetical protein, partial [Bacillus atrophaeus]|uniref:hypothetical protein n=1 Tax=Bacillus atrophaeus TaxID=1452 RepID=UPI002E1E33B3|nr:hypothetical protein [Bacillus atrophaeus]